MNVLVSDFMVSVKSLGSWDLYLKKWIWIKCFCHLFWFDSLSVCLYPDTVPKKSTYFCDVAIVTSSHSLGRKWQGKEGIWWGVTCLFLDIGLPNVAVTPEATIFKWEVVWSGGRRGGRKLEHRTKKERNEFKVLCHRSLHSIPLL